MAGLDIKFPESLKPFIDSYKQAYVGLMLWQSKELVDPARLDRGLAAFEKLGKPNAGIAITKDLDGLPVGPTPSVSHPIRPALGPLINGKNHHRLITSLTQFLVGHCHAILEEEGRFEKHRLNPEVQFLRHVRNGCFHGNRFNIVDPAARGKQWRKAKWRGKEITVAMNGRRVFRASSEEPEFFLNGGDPILLLSDVCDVVY